MNLLMRSRKVLAPWVWLVPFAVVAWQPFYGGPRPAFWLSSLAGLALLAAARRAAWDAQTRRLAVTWGLLFLPVLASWPASWDQTGTAKVAAVLALALPVGAFWLRALGTSTALRNLEWGLAAVILFWAADGLWQYAFGVDWFGVELPVEGRVIGPFEGHLRMPFFLVLLAPLLIYRLASHSQLGAVLLGALVIFVALLGGTRSQIVMGALAVIVCLPVLRWGWRVSLVGIFAAAVAALLVWSPLHHAKAEQTAARAVRPIPGKPDWFSDWNYRLGTRLTLAAAAVEMGLRNPTGVGASAFTEAYSEHTWPGDPQAQYAGQGVEINHAHHVWFSIFGEEGAAGVAGLLAAIWLAFKWWRAACAESRRRAAPYAAALAIYLFPATSHPPLYLFWLFPVIWLLVCGFLAALSGSEAEPNHVSTRA